MDLNCMDGLVGLAVIQRDLLRRLWEKHRESNAPSPTLSKAINEYGRQLFKIQKLRFDLGLDEFKGVTRGARVEAPSVTRHDYWDTQRELFNAITVANEIFERRGIRAHS
jgi:hypothetical protein